MPFDEEELDPHGECRAEIKRLQAEVGLLRRRVTVLEMVIRQDLEPDDCSDDANRMIVEAIREPH